MLAQPGSEVFTGTASQLAKKFAFLDGHTYLPGELLAALGLSRIQLGDTVTCVRRRADGFRWRVVSLVHVTTSVEIFPRCAPTLGITLCGEVGHPTFIRAEPRGAVAQSCLVGGDVIVAVNGVLTRGGAKGTYRQLRETKKGKLTLHFRRGAKPPPPAALPTALSLPTGLKASEPSPSEPSSGDAGDEASSSRIAQLRVELVPRTDGDGAIVPAPVGISFAPVANPTLDGGSAVLLTVAALEHGSGKCTPPHTHTLSLTPHTLTPLTRTPLTHTPHPTHTPHNPHSPTPPPTLTPHTPHSHPTLTPHTHAPITPHTHTPMSPMCHNPMLPPPPPSHAHSFALAVPSQMPHSHF